jgi:hypothetical protein
MFFHLQKRNHNFWLHCKATSNIIVLCCYIRDNKIFIWNRNLSANPFGDDSMICLSSTYGPMERKRENAKT